MDVSAFQEKTKSDEKAEREKKTRESGREKEEREYTENM